MSTWIGVGLSKKSEPFEAGREAVKLAYREARHERADLVVVFASVAFDQKKLLGGIRSATGTVPLVGCSDAGEITKLGPHKRAVAVMVIKSDTIGFATGMGENISQNARAAGQEAAKEADKKRQGERKAFMMLTDGLKGNSADVIRGVQEILGTSFPIVGGSAGDDLRFQKTYQYFDDQVLTNTVVGVLFAGDIAVGTGARHGWRPLGKPKMVTKAKSNRIMELDGKPAVNIYEEYFGKQAEELKSESLARLTILYPLGMSVPAEEEYLVRNVLKVDDDGSLIYGAEIPEGSEVRLMMGSKEGAIGAAKRAAEEAIQGMGDKKIKLAIIFDSIARAKLLGRRAGEEIEVIRGALGQEVPLVGFYTYGEQAPLRAELHIGKSHFHNETVVILGIGE